MWPPPTSAAFWLLPITTPSLAELARRHGVNVLSLYKVLQINEPGILTNESVILRTTLVINVCFVDRNVNRRGHRTSEAFIAGSPANRLISCFLLVWLSVVIE
jgi:hypothetical protein